MQRLAAGEVAREKYPCIVCLLETNSIQELHEHQKCFHTTEELSSSIICLVHFMCLKSRALGVNLASECPLFLQSYQTNYSFPQSHNQAHVSGTNHETQSLLGNTRIDKTHEQGNLASQYCLISSEGLGKKEQPLFNTKVIGTGLNTPFLSSLALELSKVQEISDETFFKCINEICEDLKVIGKSGVRRRQGIAKSANQVNWGPKRNGKIQTRSSTKFIQASKKMRTTGLQRSQTRTESPVDHQSNEHFNCKYQGVAPTDRSSKKETLLQPQIMQNPALQHAEDDERLAEILEKKALLKNKV